MDKIAAAPHKQTKYELNAHYWVKMERSWYIAIYDGPKYGGFHVLALTEHHQPEYFELIGTEPIKPPNQ